MTTTDWSRSVLAMPTTEGKQSPMHVSPTMQRRPSDVSFSPDMKMPERRGSFNTGSGTAPACNGIPRIVSASAGRRPSVDKSTAKAVPLSLGNLKRLGSQKLSAGRLHSGRQHSGRQLSGQLDSGQLPSGKRFAARTPSELFARFGVGAHSSASTGGDTGRSGQGTGRSGYGTGRRRSHADASVTHVEWAAARTSVASKQQAEKAYQELMAKVQASMEDTDHKWYRCVLNPLSRTVVSLDQTVFIISWLSAVELPLRVAFGDELYNPDSLLISRYAHACVRRTGMDVDRSCCMRVHSPCGLLGRLVGRPTSRSLIRMSSRAALATCPSRVPIPRTTCTCIGTSSSA